MTLFELRELQDAFIERWPLSKVEKITLEEYVGVNNKDTFCQWVETKTKMLGSIKGMTSIKFGIYERNDPSKKPKNYKNDSKYSWLKSYGSNRKEAFEKTKQNIISLIKLSEIGQFEEIDNIELPDIFKWKVAFLYSNERLIPVFKKDLLFKIAHHYNLQTTRNTRFSEIHNIMMLNKPVEFSVYDFMWQLCDRFLNENTKPNDPNIHLENNRRIRRRATESRNTNSQIRKTVSRSSIISQKHNKIQEALRKSLISKYGAENVKLEEDFVDLKVIQPNFISLYEVKSASYASDCIREALGQILLYSLNDTDERPKKHFVVGQYPPTQNDARFISFIKKNLKLEFDYIHIQIK
jgi:hypothetical protein